MQRFIVNKSCVDEVKNTSRFRIIKHNGTRHTKIHPSPPSQAYFWKNVLKLPYHVSFSLSVISTKEMSLRSFFVNAHMDHEITARRKKCTK